MVQTQTDRIVTNPDEGFICVPLTFQEGQIETIEMEGIVGGGWGKVIEKGVKWGRDTLIGWGAGKVLDQAVESLFGGSDEEGGGSPPVMITYDEPYPGYPSPRR